eukprot:scaffold23760_cov38-Prasinocladus_malaysianus.AAC.1
MARPECPTDGFPLAFCMPYYLHSRSSQHNLQTLDQASMYILAGPHSSHEQARRTKLVLL